MRELRELSLTRSAIDDSSLDQLESLGKLRKLNVTGPNCSFGKLYALFHQQLGLEQADALEAFCQIQRDATRQVHTLDIGPVGFLDKDVEILASFPELRWLDLSDCELTDRGAEALAELDWPQLEVLNLNRTKITAAGALAAARIETLKNLHLAETGCNEVEVERLKKDRPKLSVYTVDLERAQRIVRSQDG